MSSSSNSLTTTTLSGKNFKFAIIQATFNDIITDQLTTGAVSTLKKQGALDKNISLFKVPGCFELPLVAKWVARTKKYDAILCFGAVIKGETPHFDYVCNNVTEGIGRLSLKYNLPILFGVLTTNNLQEAQNRVGGKAGHKGIEAAISAIEMCHLKKHLLRKNR